ncbi:hypothetical protein PsYK624_042880 [Phanerochaete sordida]|uniref:Uncharacterized protein n=1 Tax=Phanerochaete sordida TaxID=48140 RepID=A0A9P3G5H8_9APHY|nr:hypothetical protein PsYK624_042880 [Phanerochaete sordida]
MLQMPNDSGSRIDGTERVDLSDRWEDVRSLLRLIYGLLITLPGRWSPDTVDRFGGPLKVAAKYEVDSVLCQLAPIIERDWPSQYEDWVRREAGIKRTHSRIETSNKGHSISYVPRSKFQDPAAVIQVAQKAQLNSVLPAAYYDLSRILLRPPRYMRTSSRWADAKLLDRDDLERLTVGRERIADHLRGKLEGNATTNPFMRIILHGRQRAPGRCHAHGDCQGVLNDWSKNNNTIAYWSKERHLRAPLETLEELAECLQQGKSAHLVALCLPCRVDCAALLRRKAKVLWQKIPEYFELDSLPFWTPPTSD